MRRAMAVSLGLAIALVLLYTSAAMAGPRRPVILVHGLGGSREKSWGWGKPGTFYQHMLNAGYVPEVTLFAVDYADDASGDYVEISKRLGPLVHQAIKVSGCDQVDIVAHSMGGLVARAYIAGSSCPDEVRNLVLISSPSHGSFVATAATAERLLLRQELMDTGLPVPGGQTEIDIQIAEAARFTYEAMYAGFVTHTVLSPFVPGERLQTFEAWVKNRRPESFSRLREDAHESEWQSGAPSPENGLTDGYYEYVSMCAGRGRYLRRHSVPRGLQDRIVTGLIDRVKAWIKERAFAELGQLFDVDPEAPALLRMVEEEVLIPSGEGKDGQKYDAIPANWYLARWNREYTDGREESALAKATVYPRQSIIALECVNLAGLIWKTVGPNDIAVEVDSCYLRPSLEDRYERVSQTFAFHGSVLDQQSMTAKVLSMLSDEVVCAGESLNTTENSRLSMTVTDWGPSWASLDTQSGMRDISTILLSLDSESSADVIVWVDMESPDGQILRDVLKSGENIVTIRSEGEEVAAKVKIGARLLPVQDTCRSRHTAQLVVRCGQTENKGTIDSRTLKNRVLPFSGEPQWKDGVWTVQYGDGSEAELPGSADTLAHVYEKPGRYTVTARRSNGKEGGDMLEWILETDEEGRLPQIEIPGGDCAPVVTINGPRKWTTGRPALFRVAVEPVIPGDVIVGIEPAWEFTRTYLKPGVFYVTARVRIRSLVAGESPFTALTRTYTRTVPVEILAQSIAR